MEDQDPIYAEAAKLKFLQLEVVNLDVELLKKALAEMKEDHCRKDSLMIFNPRPMLHSAKQDLDAAKIKQLSLWIELAENSKEIIAAERNLIQAKQNENQINQMFGM